MRKLTAIGVITVIAAAALWLLGGGAFIRGLAGHKRAVEVRVAFWGEGEEKRIITQTVQDWQKKHPGIKVNLEHIPSGYPEKIMSEVVGNKQPDIIFCEVNNFVTFYYKDILLDLTPFLKKDSSFKLNDFFPAAVARFKRNGKIYAIPRDTAPFACVFYNKDLFRKNGIPFPSDDWNLNELLGIAKKLTRDKSGRNAGEAGFDKDSVVQYGFSGWAYLNFIYEFGGRIVDDPDNPKKCLFNEPAAVKGMQFSLDLAHRYFVSPTAEQMENTGQNPVQLFTSGRLAMFQSGIWETPNLRKSINGKFEWDVAMFPKGPAGIRAFDSGGSGYAILNATQHPDESWEVLKCLAGDEGQVMLADSGLAQPANMKIASGPHWAGDTRPPRNKKMLNDAVRYCRYLPFTPKWREADIQVIQPVLGRMAHGEAGVKESMNEIAVRVNGLLSGGK